MAGDSAWLSSIRTFNQFVCGNVGRFQPRFQCSSADRADRVTRMRHQELLFSASVLSAAIALNNGRHMRDMRLRYQIFQPRKKRPQCAKPDTARSRQPGRRRSPSPARSARSSPAGPAQALLNGLSKPCWLCRISPQAPQEGPRSRAWRCSGWPSCCRGRWAPRSATSSTSRSAMAVLPEPPDRVGGSRDLHHRLCAGAAAARRIASGGLRHDGVIEGTAGVCSVPMESERSARVMRS